MRTSTLFEPLEPRALLAALTEHLYYPEGFANSRIKETVSLSGFESTDTEYEIWAHYETGQRDQLLKSGIVHGRIREDIRISDPVEPGAILVRENTPYALEIRSSAKLEATLRHDDFSSTAGESFTTAAGDDFVFARVKRDNATTRDFIVLYNPNPTTTTLTLEFWQDSNLAYTTTAQVEGERRSGWNINRIVGLPRGEYGVRLRASGPIIAALSHYDLVLHTSFTTLATASGGALAGALLSAEFEDRFAPDFGGPDDDTRIAVFNPGNSIAAVTLSYFVREDPTFSHSSTILSLAPHTTQFISIRELGFAAREVSVIYSSTAPIAAAAFTERRGVSFGSPAQGVAATEWSFATAFVDRVENNEIRSEDVLVFNPTNTSINVTFLFTFADGRTVLDSRRIDPLQVEDRDARIQQVDFGIGPISVRITADGPIVAALQHWNRIGMAGTFVPQGVPGGTVRPLSEVLSFIV